MTPIEKVPNDSLEVLKKVQGRKIKHLTRCSWDTFSEFNEENIWNISKQDFFRYCAGAVIVCLDNDMEIGFSSLDELNSIVMWVEKNEDGQKSDEYYQEDEEFTLIDNSDLKFTSKRERALSGQTISSIIVFESNPKSSKYTELPNEVAVQLNLANGENVVFAHGLNRQNASNTFAVTYANEIQSDTSLLRSKLAI